MKNKIMAIVGHVGLGTAAAVLEDKLKDDVELVTLDEAKERGFSINKVGESKPQPCKLSELSFRNATDSAYKYENFPTTSLYPEKKFICKGKHQYRDNGKGVWICQCGKTI